MTEDFCAAFYLILGVMLTNVAQTSFGLAVGSKTKDNPVAYAVTAVVFGLMFSFGALLAFTFAIDFIGRVLRG